MKRKLTIAAGIIHNPRVLFLDEPTTGIDVVSAGQVRRLILDLNENGTTIFLTTHNIEEAERLCHRIAFIVDGKIVRIGGLDELMRDVQQEHILQITMQRCDEPAADPSTPLLLPAPHLRGGCSENGSKRERELFASSQLRHSLRLLHRALLAEPEKCEAEVDPLRSGSSDTENLTRRLN